MRLSPIAVLPGEKLLPYLLPQDFEEAAKFSSHFTYPVRWRAEDWSSRRFALLHDQISENEDAFQANFNKLKEARIQMLKEATRDLPKELTAIAFIHDAPLWHELAIHISGPPLEKLPPPQSAVDLFSRISRAMETSFGRYSVARWEKTILRGVSMPWAGDETLRNILATENVGKLCANMTYIEVSNTVSEAVMKDFQRALPHVELRFSRN